MIIIHYPVQNLSVVLQLFGYVWLEQRNISVKRLLFFNYGAFF
jgi:hypothetical protein